MRDPYPFKGIWRWAVLPSLLSLAGILGGFVGAAAAESTWWHTIGYWLIVGFVKGAAGGGAMAIGRRPFVALGAALVLGGLCGWAEAGLLDAVYGSSTLADTRVISVAYGIASSLMVLVHLLYLRMRRRSARAARAGALLYPAAGVAGMWVYVHLVDPHGGVNTDRYIWGVAEGAFAWMALVVAARLSERATVP